MSLPYHELAHRSIVVAVADRLSQHDRQLLTGRASSTEGASSSEVYQIVADLIDDQVVRAVLAAQYLDTLQDNMMYADYEDVSTLEQEFNWVERYYFCSLNSLLLTQLEWSFFPSSHRQRELRLDALYDLLGGLITRPIAFRREAA